MEDFLKKAAQTETEREIEKHKFEIKALKEILKIEKAISKFEIIDIKNNVLSDVKLIKLQTYGQFIEKHMIYFKLNGKEIKIILELPLEDIKEKSSEYISNALYNEAIRQIKSEIST